MTPLLSIITPTFNRAEFLARTWRSIACQSEARFEWVVVDDGSTDATATVVSGFSDSRIRLIRQENLGCNAARMRGEKESLAPFVLFLDSDDELYEPKTLESMLKTLQEAPSHVGVVAFTALTPEGGSGASQLESPEMTLGYRDLVYGQKIRGEVLRLFRREALEGSRFQESILGWEALRYFDIARRHQFLLIDRPGLIYHMNHGGNLTSARATIQRARGMTQGYAILFKEHGQTLAEGPSGILGEQLFHAALNCAMAGFPMDAARYSFSSLRHQGQKGNNLMLLASLLLPAPFRNWLFIRRSKARGVL